jgi:hypothetical protein
MTETPARGRTIRRWTWLLPAYFLRWVAEYVNPWVVVINDTPRKTVRLDERWVLVEWPEDDEPEPSSWMAT